MRAACRIQRQWRQASANIYRDQHRIVNSYNEIEIIKAEEEQDGIISICVILTIEGMHVLNTGLSSDPDRQEVLQNLKTLKNWEHPPLFVTMAHHFWNQVFC